MKQIEEALSSSGLNHVFLASDTSGVAIELNPNP